MEDISLRGKRQAQRVLDYEVEIERLRGWLTEIKEIARCSQGAGFWEMLAVTALTTTNHAPGHAKRGEG